MPKRSRKRRADNGSNGEQAEALPRLTARASEVVTTVINAIALGSHGNDGELGAIADRVGMTRGRLTALLRRLEAWLTVENGFVYPTVAALRWQDPKLSESQAKALLRKSRR
jgi:hypothetical protein